MGKARDIFQKSRDTKGIFHAKISTIKDRSGMDQTEVEDIKVKWQEYIKNCSKKLLIVQITMTG